MLWPHACAARRPDNYDALEGTALTLLRDVVDEMDALAAEGDGGGGIAGPLSHAVMQLMVGALTRGSEAPAAQR